MILAKEPIARQQIAHRVVLPPQRLHGRHADQPAELFLGNDPDWRSFGAQLFGALELVALRRLGPASVRHGWRDSGRIGVGRRTKPFGANDEHRRLRIHIVGGLAAEASDERASVPPAERAEFASEDDELTGKRRRRRGSRAAVR